MAQKHIDINDTDEQSNISSSANAETLTNKVRIVYDTDTPVNERAVAIKRALEVMIEEG